MNPDEVLKKALSLAQTVTQARARAEASDATQLGELLLMLDRHLAVGGKLPARWSALTPLVPPSVTET